MLRWVLRRVFLQRFTYQMGDTMTDQKQAPERYSPKILIIKRETATMYAEPDGEYVSYAEYEALAKQRDELAAELREAEDRSNKFATKEMHTEKRALKVEAERDQALASVGAVIEKAAESVKDECWPVNANGCDPEILNAEQATTELAMMAVRSINPDATAALNEMLAEAWDEGHTVGVVWPEKERNPYRKDVKK